jgi:hypothetical protein
MDGACAVNFHEFDDLQDLSPLPTLPSFRTRHSLDECFLAPHCAHH